jgi:hypothetical protein
MNKMRSLTKKKKKKNQKPQKRNPDRTEKFNEELQ